VIAVSNINEPTVRYGYCGTGCGVPGVYCSFCGRGGDTTPNTRREWIVINPPGPEAPPLTAHSETMRQLRARLSREAAKFWGSLIRKQSLGARPGLLFRNVRVGRAVGVSEMWRVTI